MCCAKMCIFRDIALVFGFIGLSQILEVNFRYHPIRPFIVFMGEMVHSKTILLRGMLCKNVYFQRYRTILWFCRAYLIFEVSSRHHQILLFIFNIHKINYINQLARDQDKFKFCELNEIQLVEIYEDDILNEKLFENFGVNL